MYKINHNMVPSYHTVTDIFPSDRLLESNCVTRQY